MDKVANDDKSSKTVNPLVFISHDTRDSKLAEAFSDLLKKVSAGVLKSFRTSDKKGTQGIEYGIEWYPEIIKNIQEASDVVCLLTENSVNRPWILFEAGMAKGKLNTPILGVALGITLKNASTGPFAQFQNCGDDEDSLTKLVLQLLARIPNSEPDEETIKIQVKSFKDKITKIIGIGSTKQQDVQPERKTDDDSSAKLFEEIKVMFQDLPERIENNLRVDKRIKRKRKLHPMMIEELLHMSRNRTLGIMMALSLFKDSMPWMYDMGIEVIKTIKSAKTKEAKVKAISEFEEIIEMSTHHPMMREFYNEEDDFMLFREMPRMLLKNIKRLMVDDE
jgi:hypothetical protein